MTETSRAAPASWRWPGLVAVLAVALVLAGAACDGEPDEPEGADAEPAAEEPDPDGEPGEEAAAGEPERAPASLQDILGMEPQPAQVTYDLDGPHIPEGARLVVAHDPPDQATVMDSAEGEVRWITGEVDVACTGHEGAWQCFQLDDALPEGFEQPTEDLVTREDLDDVPDEAVEPAATSSETIVGRAATCFELPDGELEAVVCFDDATGILLRSTTEGPEGAMSVDATDFTDPDPALFEPPAEPVQMGG